MKFLLLLLFLIGCSLAPVKKSKPVTNDPIIVSEPVSTNTDVNLVNVLSYSGFRQSELAKAGKYIPKMNETISSKCFGEFLKRTDRGSDKNLGLLKTNEKTPDQVLNDLRTKTVDIHLITYYRRFSKVHGYTYPNVDKIWLNRKYHSGASLCSEGSNLAHELSHKLGYGHSSNATKMRPYSVPYSINAGFKECCR